jgi:hypothetical protein
MNCAASNQSPTAVSATSSIRRFLDAKIIIDRYLASAVPSLETTNIALAIREYEMLAHGWHLFITISSSSTLPQNVAALEIANIDRVSTACSSAAEWAAATSTTLRRKNPWAKYYGAENAIALYMPMMTKCASDQVNGIAGAASTDKGF